MSGYVRLHRTLIGHPAFRNDAEAMAFAWLVAKAAWKPARLRYKGRAVTVTRGQVAISIRDFATAMDRDKAWIERLLKRLTRETMVKTARETGVNIITICNYAEYQAEKPLRETAGEAPARQTQDTEQVREEVKKGSEAKASSPSAWACPHGVDPQHWRDFRKNRRTKRLTDSETAYRGQLKALDQIADDEWPPGRLVQYAAEKGWGSFHDPRTSMNGNDNGRLPQHSLRGNRPDPALDLYRAAVAAEEREDLEADRGTGSALPSYGPS